MTDRPALHALAARCGIALGYRGYDGGERSVPTSTLEALLGSLGFDGSSEELAQRTLVALDAADAQPGIAPVRVVRAGALELGSMPLRLPPGAHGTLRYRVEVVLEDGGTLEVEGEARPEGGPLALPVPSPLELGVGEHALRCEFELGGADFTSDQDLIVVPGSCLGLSERLGERRAAGVWTHLYSMWSERSYGIGDLQDLSTLLEWAGSSGFDFAGINPLHATDSSAAEVSPYYPLSRRHRDPVYLDPDRVLARAGADAMHWLSDFELQRRRTELNARPRVDYAGVVALKRPLLEAAHAAFLAHHLVEDTHLGRAHRAFRAREGRALERFATFCALRERLSSVNPQHLDWRTWPAAYRDPNSPEVAEFASAERRAVDFYQFLQGELEAQLAACAETARAAGMAIGVYGDLALGDAPPSADVWSQPELYARGIHIGAPPDPFSDTGQEWGLTPFHPLALRADRYRALRAMFRQAVRHTGLLRIDHVMGLYRQFWVPQGKLATEGTYVAFPFSDLLGLLALESRRAQALVIGEDLGVVPEGFRERMAEEHLLRSQVLYFERGWHGQIPPRDYARNAIATVSTHDLPPLAGYLRGQDLHVRRRSGNIADDEALGHALHEREKARAELLSLLRDEGLIARDGEDPSTEALVEAVQVLLSGAASRLVGIALDDLTLEHEALNTPASFLADAPNWSRRSSRSLEQIASDPRIRRLVERVVARARQD
jgi:4-alpha-glucanotransferase